MSEERRSKILRQVQALLAKANATPFAAEADTFREKADELMFKYAIEEWELSKREGGSSLKPVRKDIDMSWYRAETGAFRSALWSLLLECSKHCRVVFATSKASYGSDHSMIIPAFGLESDIGYLEMMFTDLYIQMSAKIKPKFDPNQSLGFNVFNAKEAGMKYKDIAGWVGHPEWVVYRPNGTVASISKKLITAYRQYAKEHDLETHREVSLDAYLEDYCQAFSFAVAARLRAMREGRPEDSTGSFALALRDIRELAEQLMWDNFEDLRPHPTDCDCNVCHSMRCRDPKCQRAACIERRKPIKLRGGGRVSYRKYSEVAAARGSQAGREARIMGKGDSGLSQTKEIK